ncbi:MAG: stage III sporulation protein AB [Oscillospiraceae bacterium]|nr:stage III sporulation protein AB [Oscillospiraceae bacterium]
MKTVLDLLPSKLRSILESMAADTEEIRLRAGRNLGVVACGRETLLPYTVTNADVAGVVEIGTQGSLHTALDSIKQGYITVRGGHRLGLCGTAAVREGQVEFLRDISSVNIRIAREKRGICESFADKLYDGGRLRDTLIVSPPGMGKTTVLRDLIRFVSDKGLRVSVADERGELAACHEGRPSLDVGKRTDVMDSCPKYTAVFMLLRAMGPQVIAVDEITDDVSPIAAARSCGVSLLATAHGERAVHRELFERFIYIDIQGGQRRYTVA